MSTLAEIKKERAGALEELRKQRQAIMEEIQSKAKEFFASLTPELFKQFPKLKAFGWRQYTPYFNDGDTCYFSARTDEPMIQFGEEEDLEEFYFSDTEYVKTGKQIPRRWGGGCEDEMKSVKKVHTQEEIEKNEAYEAVRELLSAFEENDYEQMFGDHTEVRVTADGVTTDTYEHD